jgi:DNA polymerase-3 subunit gamma/tau
MLSSLQSASAELYRSSNRRTDVELCLIRLCERTMSTAPESLAARISRLEEQLAQNVSTPLSRAQKEAPILSPAKQQDPPPWESAATDQATKSVAPSPPQMAKEAAIPSPVVAAAPVASNDWRQFVAALNGKLPRSAYTFLAKAEFVSGVFETEALNIYVDSDMTKTILGKAEVLQIIAQTAEDFAGRKLQVNLQLLPSKSNQNDSPSKDPFTDLVKMGKQFGNITIK